jgi:CRISPR-associated protein Cmr1
MRQAPRKPNEAERQTEPAKDDNLIVQTREYELITPLFGGGVEPGQCDDLTPIRGTEIRGHLRFWWRATQGGRFGDSLDDMRKAEAALWGAASTPKVPAQSKVQIRILSAEHGSSVKPFKVELNDRGRPVPKERRESNVPAYVAFPLQPDRKEAEGIWHGRAKLAEVRRCIRFQLEITFPSDNSVEVHAALWAWENFGGVGGRTRRGFGALHLVSVKGNPIPFLVKMGQLEDTKLLDVVRSALEEELNSPERVVEGEVWPADVPRLHYGASFELTAVKDGAEEAWASLIDALKAFRQLRNPGHPPKRSRWPEPEYIRSDDLTGQRLQKHQPVRLIKAFPRAAFGLPIIFQFHPQQRPREDDPLNKESDPRTTMLTLKDKERLASPLILRPLKVAEGKYVGLALILNNTGDPATMKLTLRDSGLKQEFVSQSNLPRENLRAKLTETEAEQIKRPGHNGDKPLLDGTTDVLLAFLDFLKLHRENAL